MTKLLPWETRASRLVICFPGEKETDNSHIIRSYSSGSGGAWRYVHSDVYQMIKTGLFVTTPTLNTNLHREADWDSYLVSSQEMLSKKDLDLS